MPSDPPNDDGHKGKVVVLPSGRNNRAMIAPADIPGSPVEQFQEQQAIAWGVIRWLTGLIAEGGEDAKWKAARMLRDYLALTSDWLGLARDLIRESEEYTESQEIRQAILDVLAAESPATRARFAQRLEEIQSRRVVGDGPVGGHSRRRGRPRG